MELLSADCTEVALSPEQLDNLLDPKTVDGAAYDKVLTIRYIDLIQQGVMDVPGLTAGILGPDAPHCVWPPENDASQAQVYLWDRFYSAIREFHKQTLDEEDLTPIQRLSSLGYLPPITEPGIAGKNYYIDVGKAIGWIQSKYRVLSPQARIHFIKALVDAADETMRGLRFRYDGLIDEWGLTKVVQDWADKDVIEDGPTGRQFASDFNGFEERIAAYKLWFLNGVPDVSGWSQTQWEHYRNGLEGPMIYWNLADWKTENFYTLSAEEPPRGARPDAIEAMTLANQLFTAYGWRRSFSHILLASTAWNLMEEGESAAGKTRQELHALGQHVAKTAEELYQFVWRGVKKATPWVLGGLALGFTGWYLWTHRKD